MRTPPCRVHQLTEAIDAWLIGARVLPMGRDSDRPHGKLRSRGVSAWLAASLAWTASTTIGSSEACAQWTQFGGPTQDFRVADQGLAKEWPSAGPRELWRRELGAGYSAIVVRDGRLYTMYRAGDKETVISLDAESGKTLWEYAYSAPLAEGHMPEYGNGPNASPLIVDGRLYTIGVAGAMHCLDAARGRVLWSHDLVAEFNATIPVFGYSSSPIAYKDTIITLVGGKGRSVIAFDKADGNVVWKSSSFRNSFSTPVLMSLLGKEQLVAFMSTEVVGVAPTTGRLLWQYPSVNQWKQNISMPVRVDDRTVFISSLEAGTRCLRLAESDGRFTVEELWSMSKVEFFYTSFVKMGDYIFGSAGYNNAPVMSAVDLRTGDVAWRERAFAEANVVGVGDRLIILDGNGVLALATASPEDLTVHCRFQLLERPAWTAPTIVGTTLYARDLKHIVALDLS